MSEVKINNSNFEDAIKVLNLEKNQYGKGKVEITNEFERGYVKGIEGAIFILKRAQDIIGNGGEIND